MGIYSAKVDKGKVEPLREFFKSKGCGIEPKQYAYFSAKCADFAAAFYESGKFVIQGKNTDAVVKEACSRFGLPLPKTEAAQTEQADIEIPERHIGTDESGKGDFFGPLVIAGVLVDKDSSEKLAALGVKDSKKLDDKKITALADEIKKTCTHSVVTINPKKYNELYSSFKNLNKLLAWGHSRAIENILAKEDCDFALSDKFGDERLIQNALMQKGRKITLEQRVRGESDIAVAAASILARAEFVRRMEALNSSYGIFFPKGASEKVIEQGIEFARKHSAERLCEVSKTHFKTFTFIEQQAKLKII